MDRNELKQRTKEFALRVMKVVDSLPNTQAGRAIGNQLIRSGTSVGANYRAACRARSRREFVAKIGVVLEEADELTAIFVASRKTAAKRANQQQSRNSQSSI